MRKAGFAYSRQMVEDVIDMPQSFALYGRDPKHDIEIGHDKVFYGTGGAGVQTLDSETGLYRASTLHDLYEFTRLADQMDNISWFTRICVPPMCQMCLSWISTQFMR